MKRPFKITIDVMAYSQQDAQAKVDLLIQMGAFCKDFDINNLADSFIKSMLISKVSEAIENKRVENASKEKEKRVNILKAWEALFEKTPKSN